MHDMHASKPAQPYWNPYVAGLGLGLVLLASFVVMGRGLGDVLGQVSPYDAGIYTLVVALMVVIAIAATLTPTRRALRVDPAAALRYE